MPRSRQMPCAALPVLICLSRYCSVCSLIVSLVGGGPIRWSDWCWSIFWYARGARLYTKPVPEKRVIAARICPSDDAGERVRYGCDRAGDRRVGCAFLDGCAAGCYESRGSGQRWFILGDHSGGGDGRSDDNSRAGDLAELACTRETVGCCLSRWTYVPDATGIFSQDICADVYFLSR